MKIWQSIRKAAFFHSLQAQLILYITFSSFIVLAAGASMNYRYTLDILERNNERYLLQQFRQADNNINIVIRDIDRLSKIFLVDEDVQQFLLDNYSQQDFAAYELKEAIFKKISSFTSEYNNYKAYSYINSIYIYTENKGCIGGNATNSVVFTDDADNAGFFTSQLYHDVRSSFPGIALFGGITERLYRNYRTNNQPYVISLARGVKPTIQPELSASVVFNVDERYIASIYADSENPGTEVMYILDAAGKIISSSDGKNIGSVNPVYREMDFTKASGSFSPEGRKVPAQIVYSKLSNTDWYLVGEIPLSFFARDIVILQKVAVFVFISSILVIFLVSFFWLKKITRPLNILAKKMRDVGRGELGLTFSKIPGNELGIVIKRFNEMSLGIKELMKKQEEIQQEKRELEIEALQSQINPHFLYNTFNMIKWMAAIIKARNIVDCIVALGNILQPTFQNTDTMCALRDEIDYLENYIKIVNWRFDDSVSFEFAIAEDLMDCRVPRFILQPIIENSITHGMNAGNGGIRIKIDARKEEKDMKVTVSDTGGGMSGEKLKEITDMLAESPSGIKAGQGGRIGILNVHRRIRLNFGQSYGICIDSREGSGTEVVIHMPIIK